MEAPLVKQRSSSSAGKPTIDLSKYASAEELHADVDANTLKTELSPIAQRNRECDVSICERVNLTATRDQARRLTHFGHIQPLIGTLVRPKLIMDRPY